MYCFINDILKWNWLLKELYVVVKKVIQWLLESFGGSAWIYMKVPEIWLIIAFRGGHFLPGSNFKIQKLSKLIIIPRTYTFYFDSPFVCLLLLLPYHFPSPPLLFGFFLNHLRVSYIYNCHLSLIFQSAFLRKKDILLNNHSTFINFIKLHWYRTFIAYILVLSVDLMRSFIKWGVRY